MNNSLKVLKYFISLVVIVVLSACRTMSLTLENHTNTSQNLMLGVVGVEKDFILEYDYNHVALPAFEQPIKVHVNVLEFNKQTYKAFAKATNSQGTDIKIEYADSLKTKPQFLKLEIADRIGVIEALNNEENANVFQFLQNKTEAHLVTALSIALNENDRLAIVNADELFLENVGVKSYGLKLYTEGKLQHTINFTDGVVFAYQTSYCCWKQNDKYQVEIVDLVKSNNKCPNYTSKSSNRAKKKIDYYKF